jgi:hypothetical protein
MSANTAYGAIFMIQSIMIIEASLTPPKKFRIASRFTGASSEVAAPKRRMKMISGRRFPSAAAAIGLFGIMLSSTSQTPGFSSASASRVAASPANSAPSASRDSGLMRLPGFTRSASVSPMVIAIAVVEK